MTHGIKRRTGHNDGLLPALTANLLARAGGAPASDRATVPGTANASPEWIRQRTLLCMIPWSASTLWRKVRDRSFVQPVKLSARVTAWNRRAVEAWLDEREAS